MGGNAQPDPTFWRGRSVFLTGHTGFVGGWLALWLAQMGAKVVGYSLEPPTDPSLFKSLRLGQLIPWTLADVRDADRLRQSMVSASPEVIFHLAAQPLVRAAYYDPGETLTVNFMGTVNVLEGVREISSLRALIVFTSDKVYADRGRAQKFREDDPLGGEEPYALSKATAELAVSAYRYSEVMRQRPEVSLVTVRAGNIIGGGDWAKDRLVPDAIRAFAAGARLALRKPEAVRPWQFVLDAVGGLLILAESACRNPGAHNGAWNLGPAHPAIHTVADVANRLARRWGDGATWYARDPQGVPEMKHLEIDASKAAKQLGWRARWSIDDAIAETIAWYKAFYNGQDVAAQSVNLTKSYRAPID
jgi:CDP-glucose 4,6-dehydratase